MVSDGTGELGDSYRRLFEASSRPQLVMDWVTLEFLAVNDALVALYGWSREELLTMSARDLRVAEEVELFERFVEERRAVPRRDRSTRGWHHRTKDGRVLHVDLEVAPFVFEGRDARLVTVTDITNAPLAERRFRLLVEHSADAMAVIDANNVVEYVNPSVERVLGYRPEELVGQSAAMLTHPDDVAAWQSPAPGQTVDVVTRARHRDGSWRWIEYSTTNLLNEAAVRGYVTNFRDVTERIESERSIRRSEAKFRILIERSPSAVFVSRGGITIYVNPATMAMLGYEKASDMLGRRILDFVHPDDHEVVRGRMALTATVGGSPVGETRMLHRNGHSVIIEAEGVLLVFDGDPAHVVLARDVTERREMFARIAVADRMVSVGTLAAGVAHEINNPLAYVMSNLALLAKELPALLAGDTGDAGNTGNARNRLSAGDVEALLADAQEGAARVSGIVRDLRALSRADDETRNAVDVSSVLASSMKMAHNELRHRARVFVEIEPGLPPVHANASRIGQVFLNLLVNAAQAIPHGHADDNEIRIRARASGDRATVTIDFEDTGAGIAPSVLGRIFDPFFTTKPVGVGTGLGLSICHQIVRSVGGDISVTSTPGDGSTFRVTLPVASAPAQEAAPISHTESPPTSVLRVLMIDDEVTLGRSTRLLLLPDIDVLHVVRAREALERIGRGERFDVILCDLMMPEMSGIELHAQLAQLAPAYLSRIVFITGGAFTNEAREFLAAVGTPHLEKPFTEAALRRTLVEAGRPRPADGADGADVTDATSAAS